MCAIRRDFHPNDIAAGVQRHRKGVSGPQNKGSCNQHLAPLRHHCSAHRQRHRSLGDPEYSVTDAAKLMGELTAFITEFHASRRIPKSSTLVEASLDRQVGLHYDLIWENTFGPWFSVKRTSIVSGCEQKVSKID